MKVDKLSGILGGVVYPMFMLPAMGFLLVQVYQINARSSADHIAIVANKESISENKVNIMALRVLHTNRMPRRELPDLLPPSEVLKEDRRKAHIKQPEKK